MSRLDRSVLSAGVAQAVERVLAVAFRNKLIWFESHYRHISLCSPGSWTRTSSSLRKQTVLVRVPLLAYFLCSPGSWTRASSSLWKTQHSQKTDIHAPGGIRTHNLSRRGAVDPLSVYFFMYPYDWKQLLKGTVEHASMMGVLGTQGGFAFALFQGWGGGVKYCWKMCSYNFSFQNKFISFLSCGLSVESNTF